MHAEHIRLAHVDEWEIPNDATGRPLRPTNYVVLPAGDSSQSSDSEHGQDHTPLSRLARRQRHVRSDSDSEDSIPLMELAKRLRARAQPDSSDSDSEQLSISAETRSASMSADNAHLVTDRSRSSSCESEAMQVNGCQTKPPHLPNEAVGNMTPVMCGRSRRRSGGNNILSNSNKVKSLLLAIEGLL